MSKPALVVGGLLVSAIALIAVPQQARSLSFPLNPGDQIVDIDLSAASQTLIYDGTLEAISVTADVDRFLLGDGSSIALSPGQVVLTMTLLLQPGSLTIGSDFFGSGLILGTYRDGGAADFALTDMLDGPTVILAGDFDAPGMALTIDVFGGFIANGAMQGTYTVLPAQSDPSFLAAITSTGTMTVQFDNLLRSGALLTQVCQIADSPCAPPIAAGTPWPGLQDFTAQPQGIDFTPSVPEPGSLSLAVLGLGITLARLRRRSGA